MIKMRIPAPRKLIMTNASIGKPIDALIPHNCLSFASKSSSIENFSIPYLIGLID
ncbi:MAG: hypothetical protein ACTSQA_04665 [Candidatus Heimdallarchaeaceae archaeon]